MDILSIRSINWTDSFWIIILSIIWSIVRVYKKNQKQKLLKSHKRAIKNLFILGRFCKWYIFNR